MNPLKKLRHHNEALALLHDSGYDGNLTEAVTDALELGDALTATLAQYNALAAAANQAGGDFKTYFVSFVYESTEHPNGGRTMSGTGMTLVNVSGGVHEWKNIAGIAEYIRGTVLKNLGIPNARNVTLLSLQEIPPRP